LTRLIVSVARPVVADVSTAPPPPLAAAAVAGHRDRRRRLAVKHARHPPRRRRHERAVVDGERRRRRLLAAGARAGAAPGERALPLVRVLVAAQRLRAVEPAPAVGAREGAVVAGGGERRRRVPGGRGVLPAGRRGVDQPQVEVDVAGGGGGRRRRRRPRADDLLLHQLVSSLVWMCKM
jgi:hypothetical protein